MPEIENIIPVFPVRDLTAAKAFYLDRLGFRLDWDAGAICSVSRDGHCLMLSAADEPTAPAMAWIGLETDALITHALATGLDVAQPPRNDPFAYHAKFRDPDGNVLWFGTGSKPAS